MASERRDILVYQTWKNPNYESIYSYSLSIIEPELTEIRDNPAHNHGFSCPPNNTLETRWFINRENYFLGSAGSTGSRLTPPGVRHQPLLPKRLLNCCYRLAEEQKRPPPKDCSWERALASWLNNLPKSPPPKAFTLIIRLQLVSFTQTIVLAEYFSILLC